MRTWRISEREIELVADLVEAGLGLGMSTHDAVAQALITSYGDHDQFRAEQPKWSTQRPRRVAS